MKKTPKDKAQVALEKLGKRTSLRKIVKGLEAEGIKVSISHLSRITSGNKCKKCGFDSGRDCSQELADALQKLERETR